MLAGELFYTRGPATGMQSSARYRGASHVGTCRMVVMVVFVEVVVAVVKNTVMSFND